MPETWPQILKRWLDARGNSCPYPGFFNHERLRVPVDFSRIPAVSIPSFLFSP
ncbi:MAG: hypothetical protein WC379_08440 [Methanoregula sp.]|jgi:hypothetical protein